MLSFFYRLLSRFKTQDHITKDMQRTFEEARTDAQARGWWSYTGFAIREIGGLFSLPNAKLWWLRIAGWGLAGLAAGGLVSYFVPVRYTSEATLRLAPAVVPQDLLPHEAVDVESLLDSARPAVLSRSVITTIVVNFDLYPNSRKRYPMLEVVKEFRKSVRIERSGAKLIRVAFTYGDSASGGGDRILANKVTQNLSGRVIVEHLLQKSRMAGDTVQFFQVQLEKVAQSWMKLSASLKATSASDPRYELLTLARDLKLKEYESLVQKLGAAETLRDSEQRGQGSKLELLDAASLPEEPDTAPSVIWLSGLACGLALGLLAKLWRALRRTSSGFTVPRAVESA